VLIRDLNDASRCLTASAFGSRPTRKIFRAMSALA
jgi:hypothetical protein